MGKEGVVLYELKYPCTSPLCLFLADIYNSIRIEFEIGLVGEDGASRRASERKPSLISGRDITLSGFDSGSDSWGKRVPLGERMRGISQSSVIPDPWFGK